MIVYLAFSVVALAMLWAILPALFGRVLAWVYHLFSRLRH